MGQGLIMLRDGEDEWFLEWSTIVDAPVTYGMTRDELTEYIREEYGRQGLQDLDQRVERCRATGTSFHRDDLEGVLCVNRAGPNESKISEREILERYCLNPPDEETR